MDAPKILLKRQSGAEAVRAALREEIITGRLAPGERLPEHELANVFRVSRTPIREALRLLLGEQLVEPRSTGGFQVTPMRASDIHDIYEIRARLEGLLARDACHRVREEDLLALRERIEQMSLLRDHENEVVRLGREFHAIIEQVADNRWCLLLLEQIRGHVDRYRALSTSSPGRSADAVAEHAAIYEALVAGEEDVAESVMREHVHRGARSALRALGTRLEG